MREEKFKGSNILGLGDLEGCEKIEIERKAVELYCTCSQNYSSKLKRADFAHGIMTFTLMFRFSVYTRDKLKYIYFWLPGAQII